MPTSDRTTKWIENLAEQERLIKAGERSSIDLCMTKDDVLEGETAAFISDLVHRVEALIELFNEKVNGEELRITVHRDPDDVVGFSCARNDFKMVLNSSRAGRIQLQCFKIQKEKRATKSSPMFSGVIEAKFGRFHDVEWNFLRSPVTPEQVARHYLTEFIQASRLDLKAV